VNKWTKGKIVELIVKALPYPSQIKDFDLDGDENAVRFTWRFSRYRVGCYVGMVEEVEGSMLSGSDNAILLERLLDNADLS